VDVIPYLAGLSALAALGLAAFYYSVVRAADPGNERMRYLMGAIQEGARAFLKQEYTWVAGFVAVMIVLIAVLLSPWSAVSYIIGAVLSASAGWAGMDVATMANARTTNAAIEGPQKALPLAFKGGAVMGFAVAGLSLLGLVFCYLLFAEWMNVSDTVQPCRWRYLHQGRRRWC